MDAAGKNAPETMYFRCRKEAAMHNDRLSSRAGAAELLGISESSLAKHELGITKFVPVDLVALTALRRKWGWAELLTERDCLKEYNIRLLILSRGRSQTITTTDILPEWVEVLVPESEEAAYRASVKNPILTIPDDVIGLGRVRNWVLRHFEDRIIVMLDDDIIRLYCLTRQKARPITDPEEITQVIINAAVMADDAGLHCFGFSQTDIRKYKGCEPFKLTGWIGGVIGVIGRQYTFRDDKYKVDIDFCLKNMLVDRVIWIDDRYCFYQYRDNNVGGNSAFRTQEEHEQSLDSLVAKWKGYLQKSYHSSQVWLKTKVQRKQAIKYDMVREQARDLTVEEMSLQTTWGNTDFYKSLNQKLRSGGELTQDEKDFVDIVETKAKPLTRDADLYRASDFTLVEQLTGCKVNDPQFYSELDKKIGTVIDNKGLTSTAPGVCLSMTSTHPLPLKMRISTPAGTKVYTLQHEGEGEIILPPGTKTKLTGYRYGEFLPEWSSGFIQSGQRKYGLILDMEVVGDG